MRMKSAAMPRSAEIVERFADGRIAAAHGDDAERAPVRRSITGAGTNFAAALCLRSSRSITS